MPKKVFSVEIKLIRLRDVKHIHGSSWFSFAFTTVDAAIVAAGPVVSKVEYKKEYAEKC